MDSPLAIGMEVLIEGRLPAVVVELRPEREQARVRLVPSPFRPVLAERVWLPWSFLAPLDSLSSP